jgi:hypothetical protein
MNFDLKNKLDLAIIIATVILVTTGAFLRFFKYLLTPESLERFTFLLLPESIIVLILFTIKIWRK